MKQGEFISNFKNLEVWLSFPFSIQASLTQGHLTAICPACTTVIKPEPTCLNGPQFFADKLQQRQHKEDLFSCQKYHWSRSTQIRPGTFSSFKTTFLGPVWCLSGFKIYHTSLMTWTWSLEATEDGENQCPKVVLWHPHNACHIIHVHTTTTTIIISSLGSAVTNARIVLPRGENR